MPSGSGRRGAWSTGAEGSCGASADGSAGAADGRRRAGLRRPPGPKLTTSAGGPARSTVTAVPSTIATSMLGRPSRSDGSCTRIGSTRPGDPRCDLDVELLAVEVEVEAEHLGVVGLREHPHGPLDGSGGGLGRARPRPWHRRGETWTTGAAAVRTVSVTARTGCASLTGAAARRLGPTGRSDRVGGLAAEEQQEDGEAQSDEELGGEREMRAALQLRFCRVAPTSVTSHTTLATEL